MAAEASGHRQATLRVLRVQLQPRQWQAGTADVASSYVYVPMSQALAALVGAALEPDSQNSYAANRLLAVEDLQLRRVVKAPPEDATLRPQR